MLKKSSRYAALFLILALSLYFIGYIGTMALVLLFVWALVATVISPWIERFFGFESDQETSEG